MSLKTEIKKAITTNSKFVAKKVWPIKRDENIHGDITMMIEVTVKRKSKRYKPKLSSDDILRKVYQMSKYNPNHDEIMYNHQAVHRMVSKYLRLNGKLIFHGKAETNKGRA